MLHTACEFLMGDIAPLSVFPVSQGGSFGAEPLDRAKKELVDIVRWFHLLLSTRMEVRVGVGFLARSATSAGDQRVPVAPRAQHRRCPRTRVRRYSDENWIRADVVEAGLHPARAGLHADEHSGRRIEGEADLARVDIYD